MFTLECVYKKIALSDKLLHVLHARSEEKEILNSLNWDGVIEDMLINFCAE